MVGTPPKLATAEHTLQSLGLPLLCMYKAPQVVVHRCCQPPPHTHTLLAVHPCPSSHHNFLYAAAFQLKKLAGDLSLFQVPEVV
jgi:hypothetical protein